MRKLIEPEEVEDFDLNLLYNYYSPSELKEIILLLNNTDINKKLADNFNYLIKEIESDLFKDTDRDIIYPVLLMKLIKSKKPYTDEIDYLVSKLNLKTMPEVYYNLIPLPYLIDSIIELKPVNEVYKRVIWYSKNYNNIQIEDIELILSRLMDNSIKIDKIYINCKIYLNDIENLIELLSIYPEQENLTYEIKEENISEEIPGRYYKYLTIK